MKKYLLGMFAVLLAIGFSAFSPAHTRKTPPTELEYYWYEIVEGKTIDAPVNYGDDVVTRAYVLSEQMSPCPDEGADLCFFGSTVDNLVIGTTANPVLEDQIINREVENR